jgi:hypothetical protein
MKKLIFILITMLIMPFATMAQNEEKEDSISHYSVSHIKHKEDSNSEYQEKEVNAFIKFNDQYFNAGGMKYVIKKDISDKEKADKLLLAEKINSNFKALIIVEHKKKHTIFEINHLRTGFEMILRAKEIQ